MIKSRIEIIYPNDVLIVLTLLKSRKRKGCYTTVEQSKVAVAGESEVPRV